MVQFKPNNSLVDLCHFTFRILQFHLLRSNPLVLMLEISTVSFTKWSRILVPKEATTSWINRLSWTSWCLLSDKERSQLVGNIWILIKFTSFAPSLEPNRYLSLIRVTIVDPCNTRVNLLNQPPRASSKQALSKTDNGLTGRSSWPIWSWWTHQFQPKRL